MNKLPANLGFESALERYRTEEDERANLVGRLLKFGIPFLDRCLAGILPTDLVLIGADTGIGKTEIATTIAKANVLAGKRVHYFALEAEKSEIERRIKYQLLSALYAMDEFPNRTITPNYLDWYLGRIDDVFSKYKAQAESFVGDLQNLYTFYRGNEFNINDFKRIAAAIREHTDLIIIDHIHYFDFESDNENIELTDTIKGIRDTVLITEVPVILVAHLRKKDKKLNQLLPDRHDIHGSSNLAKMVTKAIFLAPGEPVDANRFETYIRIDKNRIDGSRARFTGKTIFNSSLNIYEEKFSFGKPSADGKTFEEININDPRVPAWLKERK